MTLSGDFAASPTGLGIAREAKNLRILLAENQKSGYAETS
jgi:hypothetical protein